MKIKQTLIFSKLHLEDVLNGKKFSGPYIKALQKAIIPIFKKKSLEEQRTYIDDLIQEYDAIIERLEADGEHKPLKLLGLKATYGLMN